MCKHYLAYKIPSNEFSSKDIISGSKMETCPCGKFVFIIVGKYKTSSDMLSIKKSDLSKINNIYRKLYPFDVFKFTKTQSSDNHCPTCHSNTKEKVCVVEEEVEFEIKLEIPEMNTTRTTKRRYNRNKRRQKKQKTQRQPISQRKSISQQLGERLDCSGVDSDNNDENMSEYYEGDSLPYPKKTKEELDRELDNIVRIR